MDKNINYQIIVLGAILAAIVSSIEKYPAVTGLLIGLAPIPLSMLSGYYAINSNFMFEMSSYIDEKIKPRVRSILDKDVLGFEAHIISKLPRHGSRLSWRKIVSHWSLFLPVCFLIAFILFEVAPGQNSNVDWQKVTLSLLDLVFVISVFILNRRQFRRA
jgi:hypothetical protein